MSCKVTSPALWVADTAPPRSEAVHLSKTQSTTTVLGPEIRRAQPSPGAGHVALPLQVQLTNVMERLEGRKEKRKENE